MSKLVTECIGTFFLMFTIGLTASEPAAGPLTPLAVGCVLMALVYAGGHISGAHYNPAITLAVWLRGRVNVSDVPGYMSAQLIGAIVAATIAEFVKGAPAIHTTPPGVIRIFVCELLFTFALAYVVLNVTTSKRTSGKSFFGVAIGGMLLAGALTLGTVNSAAFNPAVAVGITIIGMSSVSSLWIYLAACFAGGALAALVFTTQNPDDKAI